MNTLVTHPVDFSLAQLHKLRNGEAVTLKQYQFREETKKTISVLAAAARRISKVM